MKKIIAVFFAKIAMFLTRSLRRGGGTALPGLIAEKIDKNILAKLSSNLKLGTIIITGTNGKTTTAKMIYEILSLSGIDVLTNYSGSNLSRGIVSELIARSNLFGTKIKGDICIFEIDEATMPEAVPSLRPKLVLVTNIFRDQLDRYGEVDKTVELIGNSLRTMPKDSLVILNADDPLVSSLSNYNDNALFFGIEDSSLKTDSNLAIDGKNCPLCGAELDFEYRYFGHLGKYTCSECKYKRPAPSNTVFKVELETERSLITLHTSAKQNLDIILNVPGVYNIYNALAAASCASWLGISGSNIKLGLENFTSAFGRMEKIRIKEKDIYLLLVKNPIGYNETLRSFTSDNLKRDFLLILNDYFADGTDISWIWDCNLEILKDRAKSITVSGTRAEDMALRLKYADIDMRFVRIEKDLKKALNTALGNITANETLYIFPTYTAMMELRNLLVRNGYVRPFWQPPGI